VKTIINAAAAIAAALVALPPAAHAASEAYCKLYSREVVRVELTRETEAERAELTPKDLALAISRNWSICLNSDDDPALPAVPEASDAYYLKTLWGNLVQFEFAHPAVMTSVADLTPAPMGADDAKLKLPPAIATVVTEKPAKAARSPREPKLQGAGPSCRRYRSYDPHTHTVLGYGHHPKHCP
jgi:hypothetical protein